MARTGQKLINYHSSGSSEIVLNNLDYGEIAVRHKPEQPELIIKTGTNTKAVFIDSNAVNVAIDNKLTATTVDVNGIKEAISALTESAASLSAAIQTVDNKYDGITDSLTETLNNVSGDLYSFSSYVQTNYSPTTAITQSANTLHNEITALTSELGTQSGRINTISANYATTAYVQSAVQTASDSIYASATSYTQTVSGNIRNFITANYATTTAVTNSANTLHNEITALTSELGTQSGRIDTISANYATTAYVQSAVQTASDSIYASATSYTQTVSGNIRSFITANYATTTAVTSSANTLHNEITANTAAIGSLSGRLDNFESSITETINEKLSTVYKYKGSKPNYESLPTTGNSNGDVWNVEAAHGNVPAGTNYAWVEETSSWDALAGIVDLSAYAKTTAVTQSANTLHNEITAVTSELGTQSGRIDTISANYATTAYAQSAAASAYTSATSFTQTVSGRIRNFITANYATTTAVTNSANTLHNEITALTSELGKQSGRIDTISASYATTAYAQSAAASAYTSATSYTQTVSGYIRNYITANYATTTAVTNSANTLHNEITANTAALGTLSGRVDTIEPLVNSALQGFKMTGTSATSVSGNQTKQSGAIANYTAGGLATLDLSNLVIDCGDF